MRGRPELRTLVIGDTAAAWSAAGFTVTGDKISVGSVQIRLAGGARRGALGWELAGTDGGSIDGIPSAATGEPPVAAATEPVRADHPNRAIRIDHVVVATPDLGRSLAALEAHGFEARRTRDVPDAGPTRRQVFLWAGEPIIELVGPVEPSGTGPARIWGLALTSDDLDHTVAALGPAISQPKPAVQPGRFIATLDTKGLDISVPLAVMSAHVNQANPAEPANPVKPPRQ